MRKTIWLCAFSFFIFSTLIVNNLAYGGTLYAVVNGTSNNVYTINESTGAANLLGPSVAELSIDGLAYDTSTSTMYVSDVFNNSQCSDTACLGRVNLTTGEVTIIGPYDSSNIFGLAYDSQHNILYGADYDHNSLVTLNRNTGAATIVGPFAVASAVRISGLAYDRVADTLYGIDSTNLYTINRSTGAASIVGPHGISSISSYEAGLEIDSDTGIMYAGAAQNLYQINKTTGTATLIGNSGIQISGLAYVPTAAVTTAVPSMNEWGMIIFMGLAGLGSVYYLRRQKRA